MNQSLLKVKEPKKYDIVLVGILVIMALTSLFLSTVPLR